MARTKTQDALHPLFSSPKRLTIGGLFVIMAVWLIQTSSGIPPTLSFAPIELSSNVLATMGLAWTIIQLRACRTNPRLRRAWASCAAGMALLAVEGSIGETFLDLARGPDEMGLSIVVWLVAAWLIFRGGRVFAPRRSVVAMLWSGLAIQIAAQGAGWLSVARPDYAQSSAWLEYLNDMGELSAVLAYVCALLLAVFGPLKSYQFPAASIGRKARAVMRDFGLRGLAGAPAAGFLPAVKGGLAAAPRLAWRVLRAAPAVRRSGGPSVLAQAVDLVRLGAQGVGPRSYYALGLFRPGRRDAVDEFVTGAEASGGLPVVLPSGPGALAAGAELDDRLTFAKICRDARLPVVPVYATVFRGVVSALRDQAAFDRDLVATERHGRGPALRFRRAEAFVYRAPTGETLGLDDLLARLAAVGDETLIQPGLKNHHSLAFLSDGAQIVFRVVTCLDDGGRPHVTHALAQALAQVDAGRRFTSGWGAAIDLETGALGDLCPVSPALGVRSHDDHPATGVAVRGVRLGRWPEIADLAAHAHGVFRGRDIACWDIGLTPRGPVILDGGARIDVDLLQRCYGAPLGRSLLAPVMARRIDALLADQLERFRGERRPAR